MTSPAPILIAGGGIGGLSAALALLDAGFPVHLVEQRAAFTEAGAGLQLGPNAIKALSSLGLGEAVARIAFAPDAIEIRSGTSAGRIARLPLRPLMTSRYGAGYLVAHRAELLKVLAKALEGRRGFQVSMGWRLLEFQSTADRVVLHASDGRSLAGSALIGADGLWSRVRHNLYPSNSPRYNSRAAWRALGDERSVAPEFRGDSIALARTRAHLVSYRLGGPRINLVAVVEDDWEGEGWDAAGDSAYLRQRFADWAAPVRDTLAAVGTWRKWALFLRPNLATWSRERVTLLGDAAHPVLPFMAQGAVMAIEDAVVLGRALKASGGDPVAGFRSYERSRRARTERVQNRSTNNGWIYHLSGPMALARDLTLRTIPPETLLQRLDWLYGYDATTAAIG